MSGFNQETSSQNTQQWTPERIKVEAELFLLDGGKLSPLSFKRRKREDLLNLIETSYPGGLPALQEQVEDYKKKHLRRTELWGIHILLEYNRVLLSGEIITFDEYLRRTGEYEEWMK